MPLKCATGVKVAAPSESMRRVPTPVSVAVCPAGVVAMAPATRKPVTVSTLSGSLSLVSTLPVQAPSSASVPLSATATVGSSTGVTDRSSVLPIPVLVR